MEKKKSFINIIDAAIIIVIIAIFAGSFVRTYMKNHSPANTSVTAVEYTVLIKSADKDFRRLLDNESDVYLSDSDSLCGTIADVTKTPAKTYVEQSTGELAIKYDPSETDITAVIRADARVDKNGVFVADNVFIAAGKSLDLYTRAFEFECQVQSVRIVEEIQ